MTATQGAARLMTRQQLEALAAVVFVDEIVVTGIEAAWDEIDAEYERLLAGVPRHDAPLSEQIAYAGGELP